MAANRKEAESTAKPKLESVMTTKASGHTERRDSFKESEGLTTAGEEEPSHRTSPPAPATSESRASARAFRPATTPRRHLARHRAQIRSRRRLTPA